MSNLKRIAMWLGFLGVLCAGCGDDDDDNKGTADAGMQAAAVTAEAMPTTVDCGSAIKLSISTMRFTLDQAAMGAENVAGHGHYHVYFDDATGADYLTAGGSPSVDITLPVDAAAGMHKVHVVLMNNDHTPVTPKVEDVVDVMVTSNPCVAASVMPTTVAAGGTVMVDIQPGHFTFVAPGGPNEAGKGHFHIYLDDATGGDYLVVGEAAGEVSVTIPDDTTVGAHTLKILVTANNHMPLAPEISTSLDIMVTQ